MQQSHDSVLTQREREVLALVGRGLTNQEIAEKLFTSTSTVKLCLHQSCVKLGARNRAQAVIHAMKQGALDTRDVYSLDEIADLLVSLGPEAIETVGQLLKRKIDQPQSSLGLQQV